ncbi:tRNA pseudouridine(38-40) synthase TruA [Collinsella sp. zg1085]|uniref:tRNA pseudouridine(38-40) synthase TruA n=1 Tax=Collinsella sp. zg1085 TaxID=2844380 RepID=UPI001C0E871A|nr:tRNA pseudouridine(38-40) synthase TruA [Collinsella sp. zg1085]QWT17310.1 tRNA pseudouridine(38-40) synthase TruA [Collinsella sp. zg1085]
MTSLCAQASIHATEDIQDAACAVGTIVFKLAYQGSAYAGFAVQIGQTTVAGELTSALETFLRRPVELTCAGRTDAGVHAAAQYISFPALAPELSISRSRWMRAMAALLPDDIGIQEVFHAPLGFSARFDARARTYVYRIATGEARPVLGAPLIWWHRSPLDIDAMQEACKYLIGEQDFKSFCKSTSALGKPTCREVFSASWSHDELMSTNILAFTICGNAFLHSMVRTIVGSMVEVGSARRSPQWMAEIIAARDRRAAGPTAPAQGLCFMSVSYDEGVLSLCS